jgi:hypothetical protein
MTKGIHAFLILAFAIGCGLAQSARAQRTTGVVYSVSNDDRPLSEGRLNSASIFENGVYRGKALTGSYGIGGGYLGIHSIDIDFINHRDACIFVADAGGVSGNGPGDIFAYNASTQIGTIVESAFGYNGTLYGISLVHQGNVLIAGWAGSGELETFTIGAACSLTPAKSSANGHGLSGNTVDGLAIAPNGKYAVATYEDNSYGVYPLNGATIGEPAQYVSNCSSPTWFGSPVGIAISPDSSTVYLDCLYGLDGALIDAFTAVNPSVTVTNGPITAAGGTAVNGSVTMALSPNGKVLYIVGTFSGALESANVSRTSVTANGCANIEMPGYNTQWIYPWTISVLGTGAGQGASIPETAFGNTPDSYVELLAIDGNNCLVPMVQGTDTNSLHALSGAAYFSAE